MTPKAAAIPTFSEIVEKLGEALWVVGPTGHWVFVNPTFAKFIGIHADDVYDHPLFDYIHPDDKPLCAEGFEQLKRGSDIVEVRYRLIHHDGMEIWVSNVITAARGGSRQIQYYIGASRKISSERTDTSGRSVAEGGMAVHPGAPDAPFAEIAALLTDPVWVVDTARNWVFTNPAFHLLVGYSAEELQSKNLNDVIGEDTREELDIAIKNIIEGEEMTELDLNLGHRSGESVPTRFLIKPVRTDQGGIRYFIGSSRKQGEIIPGTALPDPSLPFKTALNYIGTPAWLTDNKGNWIIINDALSTTLGMKPGETPGGNLPAVVHPDDQGLIRSAFADLKKTDIVKLSFRMQPLAGRLFWMDVTLSAIREKDDELTYVLAAAVDRTPEKSLEAEASRLRDRLQDIIDNIESAIIATDKDGKVKVINKRAIDLLDRMEFEILEQSLPDLFPDGYKDNASKALKEALGGGGGEATVEIETIDASFPVKFKYAPLNHGGVVDGVMVLLTKI